MYDKMDFTGKETYELSKTLAVDAWGELRQALYRPHERELLIRVLTEKLAAVEGAWKLLCAEVQAWARIRHPGVLQVMDWGMSGDRYYFATEMPSGQTLESIVKEDKGAHNHDEIFVNLLKSIEAARQWGVLHLGLSLTNIWLSTEGNVKVGEYGLWYVTREFSGIGEEAGLFMAPEQKSGGRVSAASDVYSLGLIYISLRYGLGVARDVAGGAPLPMDLGGMKPIVSRCLDKQPLARYRTTRELAGDLGLNPGEWLSDKYLDCPLCKLRDEIMFERKHVNRDRPYCPEGENNGVNSWVWIVMGILAVAVVMLWLLTIR